MVSRTDTARVGAPHTILSLAFWRAYWITARPYLFFISGVSGLVGLALAPGLSWGTFGLAFLAFFFSYGLGQALTDVFQTDTDAISSPYRPLTQGIITGRQVFAVSLTGLISCSAVFVWGNLWNLGFSTLAVLGLIFYTPFKRRWWAGPFWNAWIVALLPLIGLLFGATLSEALATPALPPVMLSVFFGYAIFVLLGYFKDISADRETGYHTLPVVAGWGVSIAVSAAFALATLGAALWLLFLTGLTSRALDLSAWLSLAMITGGLAMLAWSHLLMIRLKVEAESHRSIAFVVRGYTLLHLGEAAWLKPDLTWIALAFYLFFEFALALRPEQSQI